MKLPNDLQSAIELYAEKYSIKDLREISDTISRKYASNYGSGTRKLTTRQEVIAYAVARMPATFASVYSSIVYALEIIGETEFNSMLDAGAGCGAAVWAALGLLNVKNIDCIERESEMIRLGNGLLKDTIKDTAINWFQTDINAYVNSKKYDIVIASYSLNEMNKSDRLAAAGKLWEYTNKLLLIIEPGTPIAHAEQQELRKTLKSQGAQLIAPCPHDGECQLSENDWCHFITRIERSKLHKAIKNADAPYEDEKFSFSAFFRTPINKFCRARILRRPVVSPKHVSIKVCTAQGIFTENYRKQDGAIYKIVRKLGAGDLLE